MEEEEIESPSIHNAVDTHNSRSIMQGPKFWNFLYMLRQSARLCDAQLCVKQGQTSVSFPVHKVVLAGSSRYFSNCLQNNDLLDVYNFDGISTDHLQSVVDYIYRQISWSELVSNPLGEVVAQTLELIHHDDAESPNNSRELPRDVKMNLLKNDPEDNRVYIHPGDIKKVIEDTRLAIPKKQPGRKKAQQNLLRVRHKTSVKSMKEITNEPQVESVSGEDVVHQSQTSIDHEKLDESTSEFTHDSTREYVNANSSSEEQVKEELEISDLTETTDIIENISQSSDTLHEMNIPCNSKTGKELSSNNDTKDSFLTDEVEKCTEYVEVPKKKIKLTPDDTKVSSSLGRTEHHSKPVLDNLSTKEQLRKKAIDTDNAEDDIKHSDRSCSNKQKLVRKNSVSCEDNKVVSGDLSKVHNKIRSFDFCYENDKGEIIVKQECVGTSGYSEIDVDNNKEVTELTTNANSEKTENILHLEFIQESNDIDNDDNLSTKSENTGVNELGSVQAKDKVEPVLLEQGSNFSETDEDETQMSENDNQQTSVVNTVSPFLEEIEPMPLNCEECNEEFFEMEKLCAHTAEVHQMYMCPYCDYVSKNGRSLCFHKKYKHELSKLYHCSECKEKFKLKKDYFKHLVSVHDDKPYECESCDAKYVSCEGLRHHVEITHKSDQPQFMCELCGKSYKIKSQLNHHLNVTHKKEPDIPCKLCDRKFKQFSSLTRHLKTFHCDERNFKCDVCHRLFKTNDDKNKHLRRHFLLNSRIDQFGNKMVKHPPGLAYPCTFCGKMFQNFSLKKAHENIQHHDKQDGVAYLCTVCEKTFETRHYLKMHMNNTHKPKNIECPGCSLKFHFKYELKRHIPRCKGYPTVPKPYSCVDCGKTFTLKGNLTKHAQLNRCRNNPANKKSVLSQGVSSSDFVVVIQEDNDAGQVIGKVEIPLDQLHELGIESSDNNIYEGNIAENHNQYQQPTETPQRSGQGTVDQQMTSEVALHEYILETVDEKTKVVPLDNGQFTTVPIDSEMDYTSGINIEPHSTNLISTVQEETNPAANGQTKQDQMTYSEHEINSESYVISENQQHHIISHQTDEQVSYATINNEQYPEDNMDGSLVISESQDLDQIKTVTDNKEYIVYEIEEQSLSNQFCVNEDGHIVQINGENVT